MKSLNIGVGADSRGDVKLDIVTSQEPDVQATATHLPFADETFEQIIMDNVLEHTPLKILILFLRRSTESWFQGAHWKHSSPTRQLI